VGDNPQNPHLAFYITSKRIREAGNTGLWSVCDKRPCAPERILLHKLFRTSWVKRPVKDCSGAHHTHGITQGERPHFWDETWESHSRSKTVSSFAFRQVASNCSGCPTPESIQRSPSEEFQRFLIGSQPWRGVLTIDVTKMAKLTLERSHQMIACPPDIKSVLLHMVV
jgi:hypothetical protein